MRLKEMLGDAVPVALAEAKGDLDKWQTATERFIDDAFSEIDALRDFGLTTSERETVGKQLMADSALTGPSVQGALRDTRTTVFDVANAITAVGRNRGTTEDGIVRVDARLELEELGYDYLTRKTA